MRKISFISATLALVFISASCFDRQKIEPDTKTVTTVSSSQPTQEPEEQDDCKKCMSIASETCLDLYVDCLNVEECSEYLLCEESKEQSPNHSGCYPKCQTSFVDTGELSSDLKTCACSMCEFECEASCRLEE